MFKPFSNIYASIRKMFRIILANIIVIAVTTVIIMMATFVGLSLLTISWSTALIVSSILGLLGGLTAVVIVDSVHKTKAFRMPVAGTSEIPVRFSKLSDRSWLNICHVLDGAGSLKPPEEREVIFVIRRHMIDALPTFAVAVPVVCIDLLAGFFAYAQLTGTSRSQALLAVGLVLALTALGTWISLVEWLYWTFILTDEHIIQPFTPPAFLFWMKDPTYTISLRQVDEALEEPPDNGLGKVLHIGKVNVGTKLTGKEEAPWQEGNLHHIPDYKERVIDINNAAALYHEMEKTRPPMTAQFRPRHVVPRNELRRR